MGVFRDSDGTESCGCNEPGQILAGRWVVRDEESIGLWLAQFAVRKRADCVCAEDTRGCNWMVVVPFSTMWNIEQLSTR